MKQRVCIAMAIALHPALLVADEPTSALDVVVQRVWSSQTLVDVQARLGVAVVLIGHDIALQAQLVDRMASCAGGIWSSSAPLQPCSHPPTLTPGSCSARWPSLRQSSWVPAAASAELREEAYRLAAVRIPLRPAGPDHEVALP